MRLESEKLDGSIWDQEAISNASSSLKAFSEDQFGQQLRMLQQQSSLDQFKTTELAANFNKVFQNKKLPFKYKTLFYLQKILYSKEVETDIQEFR